MISISSAEPSSRVPGMERLYTAFIICGTTEKRFAHLKNHLINFLKVLFFGDPVNLLDDVYNQTQLVHVQASRTMRLRTCLMRASL